MLWLDSNEEIFRDMHNQYMLGDDLIVAPVIRRNQTNRGITLPKVIFICFLNFKLNHRYPYFVIENVFNQKAKPYIF